MNRFEIIRTNSVKGVDGLQDRCGLAVRENWSRSNPSREYRILRLILIDAAKVDYHYATYCRSSKNFHLSRIFNICL